MTESALPVAIEARELGKSAHRRLDNINGQIDRGNRKLDEIESKVTSVLITLARDDGAERATRGFVEKKQVWVGLAITALTSSTGAAIFTLVIRRHG